VAAGLNPVESDPRRPRVVAESGEAADPDPRTPTDRPLRDLRILQPFPFIGWGVDDVHPRLGRARRADRRATDGAVV
jgi:hypothetical protein